MLWFQSLLIALPLYTVVLARALGTRQNDRLDIDRYISRVQTALQVINNISAGNASESCSDPDFPTRFEEAGYDGQYAQMLLYARLSRKECS